MKVQALIALKADFSLPVLLQVSGLARYTFFYHQGRLLAPDPQEELKSSIMDIFKKNYGRYGHRRVHGELLNQGWTVAKKTVLKIMRALGLSARSGSGSATTPTKANSGQKPLVHSDQGFQYRHTSWRTLLGSAGAVQSGSRKGNCYDNAVIENFFGHLKEELFHHVRFLNTDALATALHEYIRWYNTERISTKLKGLSPVQYRAQARCLGSN
ncbi:IS3 family transposase [Arthrobacter sp. FW305-BF8]|uniref:IS3 family transposase n=1 Tax=Arthrobacter sp. FW305-BF8 TaxID=2879617 RepID=UPI001F02DD36|nr:IS3 family transposase [Arthrobacter sp. FW305-BF8]UKA52449.1 IS3 family transposase [Arthrobacter sp. FW305-BF8]